MQYGTHNAHGYMFVGAKLRNWFDNPQRQKNNPEHSRSIHIITQIKGLAG